MARRGESSKNPSSGATSFLTHRSSSGLGFHVKSTASVEHEGFSALRSAISAELVEISNDSTSSNGYCSANNISSSERLDMSDDKLKRLYESAISRAFATTSRNGLPRKGKPTNRREICMMNEQRNYCKHLKSKGLANSYICLIKTACMYSVERIA